MWVLLAVDLLSLEDVHLSVSASALSQAYTHRERECNKFHGNNFHKLKLIAGGEGLEVSFRSAQARWHPGMMDEQVVDSNNRIFLCEPLYINLPAIRKCL